MKLNKKQTAALDLLEDQLITELLFGGGAGGGKSILGCYWLLKSALKFKGTRWVMARETLKTLKETTLNSFYTVCAIQGMKVNVHYRYNENKSLITLFNGSEILLKELKYYPSDPNFDELGSLEITGAFVDECNQTVKKAWTTLKSRIRYKLDHFCHVCADKEKVKILKRNEEGKPMEWICTNNHHTQGLMPKILGSCNPAKNWVYSDFFSPWKKKTIKADRAFIQSLVTDNPDISVHYRTNLLSLDKASKERLLFGNWDYQDDPDVLCDIDAINDAFTNEHVKPGKSDLSKISADLAMQGRDRFVAGIWKGLRVRIAIDQEKSTGKSIENDLKKLMIDNQVARSQTVADSDGLGNYLESYLNGIKEFHGGGKPSDKEYDNIKSQCAFLLADKINKREIIIECTEEQKERIIEELQVLKRRYLDGDTKKKSIIEKKVMKELLGRSPDYLDVLIMGMWFYAKVKEADYSTY